MAVTPIEIHPRAVAPPPPHHEPPYQELFDWQKIRRYVFFSLGSIRRRRWLFLLIFGGMVLLAAGGLAVMPRTYEVETRLLAQKNAVLAVRADSNAWEVPTRSAADTILRRDNLHALIRETNLIEEWPKRRAPILRLKDWLQSKLGPPPTDEERLLALTGLLQNELTVWTTPDGTVVIKLRWPDGAMACRIVEIAQQRFIETRHVAEISTIGEQIAILEGHSAELKAKVEKGMAEVQLLRERSAAKGRAAKRPAAVRAPPVPDEPPEVVRLRVMLEAKRRAISDLDEFRRHRLVEQQTRMMELAPVYSKNNPVVVDLQKSIEALENDSPELRELRQEEARLRAELEKRSDRVDPSVPGLSSLPQDLFRMDGLSDDPALDYARAQLLFSAKQYAAMRERIDSARVELDTARAAFKYRYSVILPPEIPRGPVKPKAVLVMVAASLAGLLLALLGTTVADLRSGAVLEPWQVLDLLGPAQAIVEVHFP